MGNEAKNEVSAKVVYVQKESKQVVDDTTLQGLQYPQYDFNKLADLYDLNSYHSSCIDIKAVVTCGLGFSIEPVNEGQEDDEQKKKLEDFLENHKKKAGQTFIETLVNFATDYELFGNAYLEIVRNNKKEVAEVYHMPAKDCLVQSVKKRRYLVQRVTGLDDIKFNPFGEISDKENEYIHYKNHNPKDVFYGRPMYLGAIKAMVLDQAAIDYNIYKFENNSIPESVIVVEDGELDRASMQSVENFFSSSFKGVGNVGRSLILQTKTDPLRRTNPTKITVTPLQSGNKDGSFRLMRMDNKEEVITAHRVPKSLLGIETSGKLGNSEDGELIVFKETIIEPRQTKLEYLINEIILKEGMDIHKWKIEFKELNIDNLKSNSQFYDTMLRHGVLENAEVRKELGYPVKSDSPTKSTEEKGYEFLQGLVSIRKQLSEIQQ